MIRIVPVDDQNEEDSDSVNSTQFFLNLVEDIKERDESNLVPSRHQKREKHQSFDNISEIIFIVLDEKLDEKLLLI